MKTTEDSLTRLRNALPRKRGKRMIKSMTGFGRGENISENREVTVEIRSVNHRYFEFSSRLPRSCGYLEEKLKSFLQEHISRGKVEISVQLKAVNSLDTELVVNQAVIDNYISTLRKVAKKLRLKDDLSASTLLRINDAFDTRKKADDEEEVTEEVLKAAVVAVEKYNDMRTREGENLKADILSRVENIEANVARVEQNSEETLKAYRERLYARIKDILGDRQIDDQRVLTEVAIFSDKIAVDEETVRLKSHIAQMREMLNEGRPVGRKLDFLIQEFNREANTIGSKCQNVSTAQTVVDIKSDIEKIREQIQNIE